MGLAAFDIEARWWDSYRVGAFVTEEGDVDVCRTREELRARVLRHKGQAWSHYGGRYDMLFLMPLPVVVLAGAGIMRAQLGQAQLHDSYELMRAGLAKVGDYIGRPKLKGLSESMDDATDAEAVSHATNDALIALEALQHHRAWWGRWCESPLMQGEQPERWPTTAGGCAVELLRAVEPEVAEELAASPLTLEEWTDHYEAQSGARSEVFHLGHVDGLVTTLDVNSSYPARWLEGPLPCGPWRAVEREEPDRLGVYLCEVRQCGAFLPLVAPELQWRYCGRAWLTSEELRAVREARGTARVVRGWVSDGAINMGHRLIPALYAEKLEGIPWSKAGLNALSGKTLQGPWGETYYHKPSGYVRDAELALLEWYQRPLVGAFIQARARLALWRAMQALVNDGWRVLYVDTDGLHTDCPPALLPAEIRVGVALGEWKVEGIATEAVYLAPKVYGLKYADGSEKLIVSGVPRGAVSWENLQRASRGYTVEIATRSGLEGFMSCARDNVPKAAEHRAALSTHTGGKRRVRKHRNGNLWYRDARDAA